MSTFNDNRPDVKFNHVGGENDGQTLVAFKYKQPSVSVQTSARFATHDVFGDITVRQKLGEEPDEISIEGRCTAEEANIVDMLVYEEVVELVSDRWSGVVHVASTSTDPIADGGGQDLDGDWVYEFNIECVEITESFDDTTDIAIDSLIDIAQDSVTEPQTAAAALDNSDLSIKSYPTGTLVEGDDVTFSGGLAANDTDEEVSVFFEYRTNTLDTGDWQSTSVETLEEIDSFQIQQRRLQERIDYDWRAVGEIEFDDGSVERATGNTETLATGHEDTDSDKLRVATLDAENHSNEGEATLYGEVTDMVGVYKTEVWFEYKLSDDDAWTTTGFTQELTEPGEFSETVDALGSGTQEHDYRAVASVSATVSDYEGNSTDRGDTESVIF